MKYKNHGGLKSQRYGVNPVQATFRGTGKSFEVDHGPGSVTDMKATPAMHPAAKVASDTAELAALLVTAKGPAELAAVIEANREMVGKLTAERRREEAEARRKKTAELASDPRLAEIERRIIDEAGGLPGGKVIV